ncbi:MAG TPA: flagellar hook-basal body complex protein [Amphiplicatus sp.]|nr:flagellar hook-basal body complex protein [Amphiplicatus sp.]HRX38167.1 flagellar hook-basal body complex protein [Parvularculaceae bacterium]
MGLSSSLNAGVMGLSVNATKLSTISDNIANSETYGYKRSDAEFTNMVISQGSGTYTAGGVRVTTFKDVDAQGALVSTANSTDISVSGRGLLPVTSVSAFGSNAGDTAELLLTSTGSFQADENGYLKTLSGLYLLGWPANADGTVTVPGRDSAAGLEPVNITNNQFAAAPTSTVSLGLNLPATATHYDASGDSYELPVEYFDNLGSSQTLDITFIPQIPASGASNTWTVEVRDRAGTPPTAVVATFDIVFDDSSAAGGSIQSVVDGAGATYDSSTGTVALNVASGPMSLYIGEPLSGGPMTQLSADFSPVSVTKDGAPIGSLSYVEINDQGMIEAIYDNGFRRTIYQIPIADVPNLDGLRALDNQTFAISQDSGLVYFWDAGTGPVGTTTGYALAESTTDIAAELTDLIETQRAYSSNAKIIQTVDEMLQETTNLKR